MKKYLKSNALFLLGMFSLLAANIPSLYGAIATGKTAPTGFLILVQLGMAFYLADAVVHKRPQIFAISGILNSVLNAVVLMFAIVGSV